MTTHAEVLIIGAGPSGLFAAAELARHGVPTRLVERDLEPHREARATAIQPGTLEILATIGLLPPVLEAAERIHCARTYAADLSEIASMSHEGIDCCCEFQCSLPQYETQRILETHLASLGGTVERGVTAAKADIDTDGVVVELVHHHGKTETVRPTFVIGAGGAHSITRHSMSDDALEGMTYQGRFLAADFAMAAPFPRTEAGVVCGPNGLLLIAPLPGGRWISFQDLAEDVEDVSAADVIAGVVTRLGDEYEPSDVTWFSSFRMRRRIVSRLADGHRFLIGDAAHLSSPFGGEGLNAGLQDACDLAWKLALVIRGHATRALLDSYAVERSIADRHVLDVSDQVHCAIADVVAAARQGLEIQAEVVDPVAAALMRDSRAMIDVDYKGSPLVVDHVQDSDDAAAEPHPGQWYPDWRHFGGTSHRLLMFGTAAEPESLARFARRWPRLEISDNPSVDPARAGLPAGGMIVVRPDGHIGFRYPSTGTAAFAALDSHLSSYLIPDPSAASGHRGVAASGGVRRLVRGCSPRPLRSATAPRTPR